MFYPNFRYEKLIWSKGYKFIAGIDEVGRGSFAGPVVAGCVVFDRSFSTNKISAQNIRIDDSKKLSVKKREHADVWIRENALTWGVGEATSKEIDKLGIVKATNKAIRSAVGKANQRLHNHIDYLLIDAFYIPYVKGIQMGKKSSKREIKRHSRKHGIQRRNGQQLAIVKGDEKSISISAASIIAKVYRDNLMIKLASKKRYKKYHWDKNKGYGTKEHREKIKRYGISAKHRLTFIN
jgi:ribonuclease HII